MEETLASPKMAEIDLIKNLEKISSEIPNRILKLEGFILKENQKEQLEIIIFRGYSSSTTHPIEIDSEKKVITLSYTITNFKLYKAPLTETEENLIRENTSRFLSAKCAKYSTSISFPLSIGDIKPKLDLFKVIFESDGNKPRISISSFLKTSLINFLCLFELTLLKIIPDIDNLLS